MSLDTFKRTCKFAVIGIVLALFNFIVYTFLARVVIGNNDLLWLDSIVSYFLATFLAYFLHSKITWKERMPTKSGVIKFFLWNFITAIAISPFFTWLFGFITPSYRFIFQITSQIHLPFDYNFIESTSIFCLTTCVTMILNYLFYDRLVFGIKYHSQTYNVYKESKVSVIVPIYNTAKYLKKCLDSIIHQTHLNLEIILVDDGSTDDSGKIADHYTKIDQRVKVIHQPNQGQSAARNIGLSKATGDFISFIDSDDHIKPSFIADLLASYSDKTAVSVCGIHYRRLGNHTSSNVYTNPLRTKHRHESLKAYILYLLAVDGRMYSSVNKLYRAEFAKKCYFDTTLNFAEDTKFVLDYLKKTSGEINFILKPLYIYNFGTETSTIKSSGVSWNNWQTSYKNLRSWLGTHPKFTERFWLHVVHLRWRISFLRSKRRAKYS